VELYEEYRILKMLYGVKKGSRTDLIPEIGKAKERLLKRISKSTLDTYDEVFRLASELTDNEEEKQNLLAPLYKGEKVSTFRNQLRTQVKQRSMRLVRNVFRNQGADVRLIQSTCEGAIGVEKESVQCIMSSPPDPNSLRDYGLGSDQLGAEKTVEEYVSNLVGIFKSVKHTLKPTAKVFVNLMDSMEDGIYWNSIEHFIIAMVREGFYVADRIVWVKNNPNQTSSSSSNISHEHIICFTLEKKPTFNKLKYEDGVDFKSNSVAFNEGNRTKSYWSVTDRTITTNTNSFSDLKKRCEKRGVTCNHSAGYPVIIPDLCIRLATEPGDTVMDIFSGTATTGEAALMNSRNYIGFEALPDYHEVAKVRLEDYLFRENDNLTSDDEEYLEAA
jgi:site-specific DNA-methyltransferase (adenine-specific)